MSRCVDICGSPGPAGQTGRTYAGATVALSSLQGSAVGVAVAMAVSSGGDGLEAVAVVTDEALRDDDLAIIREYGGPGVLAYRCGPDGVPVEQVRT